MYGQTGLVPTLAKFTVHIDTLYYNYSCCLMLSTRELLRRPPPPVTVYLSVKIYVRNTDNEHNSKQAFIMD